MAGPLARGTSAIAGAESCRCFCRVTSSSAGIFVLPSGHCIFVTGAAWSNRRQPERRFVCCSALLSLVNWGLGECTCVRILNHCLHSVATLCGQQHSAALRSVSPLLADHVTVPSKPGVLQGKGCRTKTLFLLQCCDVCYCLLLLLSRGSMGCDSCVSMHSTQTLDVRRIVT